MNNDDIFSFLPGLLLPWYRENRRQLPWREDRQPYHIWVSEIMLQQTRVEAVKGYYSGFLNALPTVEALAAADDELLHKLWEGLGYYNRVRNMKKAAATVAQAYGGTFPADFGKILSLPGIGDYTAGAICSIAFDMPTPAVDGNVLRVVSRLTNDSAPVDDPAFKRQVRERLQAVYPPEAGEFTQALMELGATVCGPNRRPDCPNCPCARLCAACKAGTAEELPVKLPKRRRREEDRTVFILQCDGAYCLRRRPNRGLLAGLWEFPNVEGKLSPQEAIAKVEEYGIKPTQILRVVEKKHIFTHIQWNMCGVYMQVRERTPGYSWLTTKQIREQAALPTAFRQFRDETEET